MCVLYLYARTSLPIIRADNGAPPCGRETVGAAFGVTRTLAILACYRAAVRRGRGDARLELPPENGAGGEDQRASGAERSGRKTKDAAITEHARLEFASQLAAPVTAARAPPLLGRGVARLAGAGYARWPRPRRGTFRAPRRLDS